MLVAKLTLGALAQGDRWFGGRTNNPWNPQAARAARRPARARRPPPAASRSRSAPRRADRSSRPRRVNGVVGLRPTYGRVSRYGAMALSTTMDKIGPMCRYVEDAVLVLNAIYGPDKRDGSVADAAFKWNPDAPLVGLQDRLRPKRRSSAAAAAAAGGGWRSRCGRRRQAPQRGAGAAGAGRGGRWGSGRRRRRTRRRPRRRGGGDAQRCLESSSQDDVSRPIASSARSSRPSTCRI